MRRVHLLLAPVALLAVSLATHVQSSASSKPLTIAHCRLLKDGKPFRAIGMNYLTLLTRSYADPGDTSGIAGLNELATRDIPFVRFALLPMDERQLRAVVARPDAVFAAMDAVVRAAEANGVGLVPSMFFEFRSLPRVMGEPVSAWGDAASKTRRFADAITYRIAARHAGSRAIWMWEFANEANDWPDQADAFRYYARDAAGAFTARDNYSSVDLDGAFAAFRDAIGRGDPGRLVEPGYNIPRNGAWNRRNGRNATDTVAQFQQGVAQTYRAADMISIHLYPANVEAAYAKRFADRPVATAEAFVPFAVAAARQACKPLFVGEFGPDPVAVQSTGDPQAARFASMLKAIVDNDVPLAALWVYDFPGSRGYDTTAGNRLSARLQAVQDANRRIADAR